MLQHTVRQNISIPYSKQDIIKAVQSLISKSSSTYMNLKINESFGTIQFTIVNKIIFSFLANLTLKSIVENETEIDINLSNLPGSGVSEANMLSTFSDFLNLLDKELKGEILTSVEIKKVGSGCMFFLIAITISLFAFFYNTIK